ncbi:SDR family NAD(P)-dependent oxidoreductase [Novosphingobium malaysiense]|nr:SDR family NAD(P)-dependent oxidoreductase [Novosphingobium malaysiense]
MDMQGKVAIVTGAGSGLGRASALALGQRGAGLCLVDIDEEGLEETARRLPKECHAQLRQVNLADPVQCGQVVEAAVGEFGRLDALCNVAGIIVAAHAHEMLLADWNRVIAVNLTAPFLLARAAIPHLIASGGAIVNVASSAAFVGEAYASSYCASKAGLVAMTKALAMEYSHETIRINTVAPGGMDTGMGATFLPPEGADFDLIKRYSGLRGLVQVEDVAAQIVMLASPAGRSFHGACINIDAGITAG